MKKVIFSLLFLVSFAAANTCTEAVFKYTNGSLEIITDEAYHDSSYFLENYTHTNEWSHKLYYTNGKIDSLVMDPMEEGEVKRPGLRFHPMPGEFRNPHHRPLPRRRALQA